MRSRVKSERGEGEEEGKGGVKEEREGIEGETHLTDKPRLHRWSDDSSVSYPTPQTDSLTALPLIHCTLHFLSRFDLYPVRRSVHHTCSPGEECRVRNTCNRLGGHQPFLTTSLHCTHPSLQGRRSQYG